jgi:hypothetical protein
MFVVLNIPTNRFGIVRGVAKSDGKNNYVLSALWPIFIDKWDLFGLWIFFLV